MTDIQPKRNSDSPGQQSEAATTQSSEPALQEGSAPRERLPGMPEGFFIENGRIWRTSPGKGGTTTVAFPICGRLMVKKLASRIDGSNWTRVVEGTDRTGKTRTWFISEAELGRAPGRIIAMLQDRGFWIGSSKEARAGLVELIADWTCTRRTYLIGQPGWADTSVPIFVMPNGSIVGPAGLLADPGLITAVPHHAGSRGTLDSWKAAIAARCVGNPLLLLAVAMAFSGPLLKIAGLDSGGVHLRGSSSRGKTSILQAAASVWGPPAFNQSWRATANGLEHLATAHTDTLLALDELAEIAPSQLGEAVYLLGNGRGKTRMKPDGSRQTSLDWRVMVLSSGEITIAEQMAEANRRHRAGQEARLLDIEADGRRYGAFDMLHGFADGAAFADSIKAAVAENFGAAGRCFVEKIAANYASIADDLPKTLELRQQLLLGRAGNYPDGLARRAAKRLALIMCAGELASSLGVTDWPALAVQHAVGEVYGSWLANRSVPADRVVDETLQRIRRFVAANAHRFILLDDGTGIAPTAPLAGWISESQVMILADAWREANDPADPLVAAKSLRHSGHLIAGEGDNLARKLPARLGTGRAYTLRRACIVPNPSSDDQTPS